MNAIDQLVRELQDRKPQWASAEDERTLNRPQRKKTRAVSHPSHREWIRTILLSGVVVAGLIALQQGRSDEPLKRVSPQPLLRAQAVAPQVAAPIVSTWQLDWRLSLDKLRTTLPESVSDSAARVALSPSHDMSQDTDADAVSRSDDEPDRLATALLQGHGPLMIDPPAAGRAQSVAHQVQTQYRRAMDLLEKGRETAALDALSQVLSLEPQHVAARRLAITVAVDHQQGVQAQAWLDEGIKLHPDDTELRTLQARLLSQAGAAEEALGVLQELPYPDSEALGMKAGLLVKLGRHAQAVSAYEQALKTRPDNASWWLGLGVSWQAQGQNTAAREAFARAWQLGQQGQLGADVQAWLEKQM